MTHPILAQNVAVHASPASLPQYTAELDLRPAELQLIHRFFPPPPARVLDLGCGAGRTTAGLARHGYQVIGVDLSDALLSVARARHPQLPFVHMDAAALEYDDASFDAVLFSFNGLDYLYPLAARRSCLRAVHRVLRPGGTFIFSSHNVIGEAFAGGYRHPRSYLRALRFFAAQMGSRHIRDWYIAYREPGGEQIFYSAPPRRTVADAHAAGFDVAAVWGEHGDERRFHLTMHARHVHFVCRKPR